MAIDINIYYTGAGDNALEFAKEMISSGIVEEIRSHAGNLRYEYFKPLEDENTILLIDSWENQEALARHHESDVMEKISKLREKYDLKMRVYRFVSDENISEKDRKFIRT